MDSVAIFCNKALEIDPNAIDAMVQLSLYYARTKKNEEALRLLEKANRLNQNNFAANRAMGDAGQAGQCPATAQSVVRAVHGPAGAVCSYA